MSLYPHTQTTSSTTTHRQLDLSRVSRCVFISLLSLRCHVSNVPPSPEDARGASRKEVSTDWCGRASNAPSKLQRDGTDQREGRGIKIKRTWGRKRSRDTQTQENTQLNLFHFQTQQLVTELKETFKDPGRNYFNNQINNQTKFILKLKTRKEIKAVNVDSWFHLIRARAAGQRISDRYLTEDWLIDRLIGGRGCGCGAASCVCLWSAVWLWTPTPSDPPKRRCSRAPSCRWDADMIYCGIYVPYSH